MRHDLQPGEYPGLLTYIAMEKLLNRPRDKKVICLGKLLLNSGRSENQRATGQCPLGLAQLGLVHKDWVNPT
jgi:hypothetical protein